jgi:peptide deformylase
MPARKILRWPNPQLYQVAQSIEHIDDAAIELARDLIDSMKAELGAGLAATQINVHRTMVVIATGYVDEFTLDADPVYPDAIVLINPQFEIQDGETFFWEEACLSVPEYSAMVERHRKIKLEYQNLSGDLIVRELDSPFSGIVQHEVDHLEGKLYLDRLPSEKKRASLAILRERINKKKKVARQELRREQRNQWAESAKKGFRMPSLRGSSRRKKPRKTKK